MLDPLLLKNDLDSLKDNLKRRNLDVDLEQLIKLDESRRKLRFEAEKLRADQKLLGKDIANAEPKESKIFLTDPINIEKGIQHEWFIKIEEIEDEEELTDNLLSVYGFIPPES